MEEERASHITLSFSGFVEREPQLHHAYVTGVRVWGWACRVLSMQKALSLIPAASKMRTYEDMMAYA